ncbi:MAG TPA: hypothetical protein VGD67_13825 [Pseudonocardiaceae bacterium]
MADYLDTIVAALVAEGADPADLRKDDQVGVIVISRATTVRRAAPGYLVDTPTSRTKYAELSRAARAAVTGT